MVGRKLVSQEASQEQENKVVMQEQEIRVMQEWESKVLSLTHACVFLSKMFCKNHRTLAGDGYDYDSDVASLVQQGEIIAEERTNFG